jgi:hypothetical protein
VWLLGTSLEKHRDVLAHAASGSEFLLLSQLTETRQRVENLPIMLDGSMPKVPHPSHLFSAATRLPLRAKARHDETKHP